MSADPPPSIAPLPSLVEVAADAAAQADLLRLDAIDREDDVFAITYAVDSNILYLQVDPRGRSARSADRKLGSGEVFRHDDADRKTAIAAAISHFVWFRLQPTQPLLLIPPVDVEVIALLNAALTRTGVAKADFDRIDTLIRDTTHPDRRVAEQAVFKLRTLLTTTAQVSRLNQLIAHGRFLSVDLLDTDPGLRKQEWAPSLAPFLTFGDIAASADAARRWKRELVALGRPDNAKVDRDADAMGRLTIWNRRLARLSPRRRIVYITGDNSLLTVGESIKVDVPGQALADGHPLSGRPSFRDYCLRHPRSFLDRPGCLSPDSLATGEAGPDFSGLARLLLGEFLDGARTLGEWKDGEFLLHTRISDDLRRAGENDRSDPPLLQRFLASWGEFADKGGLLDVATDKELQEFDAAHQRGYAALREYLGAQAQQIQQDIQQAWSHCITAVTEARFLIGIIRTTKAPDRLAPRLCLDGGAPEEFLASAEAWFADPSLFDPDHFLAQKAAVEAHDPSGYKFLVITAFLLAHGQHWPSAAFICANARAIAHTMRTQADTPRSDGPNGREAAFLEAFCRRHAARSLADLADLDHLLDEATRVLEDEAGAAEHDPTGDAPPDAVPERFEGERLALRFSRMLFRWNAKEKVPDGDWERLALDVEKFRQDVETARATPRRTGRLGHLEGLRQRALINLVALGLQRRSNETIQTLAARAYRDLQDRAVTAQRGAVSSFSQMIRHCGAFHYGDRAQRSIHRTRAIEYLDKWRERQQREGRSTLPYDARRLDLFREGLDEAPPRRW